MKNLISKKHQKKLQTVHVNWQKFLIYIQSTGSKLCKWNILNAYTHFCYIIKPNHWLNLPQIFTYSEVAYLDKLEEEDIFIIPVVLGGGIIWLSTPWVAPFFCGLGGTSGGSFLGEFPSSSSGFSGSGKRGVTLPSAYSNSWGRGVFLLTWKYKRGNLAFNSNIPYLTIILVMP